MDINKTRLINEVGLKTGYVKSGVETIINEFLNSIEMHLKEGDTVKITGFGRFTVHKRAAHIGHNPQTNQPIDIPARNSVSFKSGASLRKAVAEVIEDTESSSLSVVSNDKEEKQKKKLI